MTMPTHRFIPGYKTLLCAVALFIQPAAGSAQEKSRHPLTEFINSAMAAYELCLAHGRLAGQSQHQCMAKERDAVRQKFLAATKTIAKDRPLLAMTRDYYSYWYSIFETLPALPDETKLFYGVRTGEASRSLLERRTRLELELPP